MYSASKIKTSKKETKKFLRNYFLSVCLAVVIRSQTRKIDVFFRNLDPHNSSVSSQEKCWFVAGICIIWNRVLSGQGKPGKPGKTAFFSKSQGKPGKVRENQKNQYKIREKSGNFFSVYFVLECFASICSTRVLYSVIYLISILFLVSYSNGCH